MYKTMTFREKYEMLPQKKQTFYANGVEVRIMVMPWPVPSLKGRPSIRMEATVFTEKGLGVRGISTCVPPDEFDFRFGAELALKDALSTKFIHSKDHWHGTDGSTLWFTREEKIVSTETRKAIWKEFNRVLPK
jgi:hypothetical protein